MHDLIIVGSGPAGLSAALAARRHQLDCLILERGVIGETVYHFPIARSLFSTSNEVELEAGALPQDRKPSREEVLAHYTRLAIRERLNLHTGEAVEAIRRHALDAPSRMNAAKIKPWVREPLEGAQAEGRLDILASAEVVEIFSDSALLQISDGAAPRLVNVPCDHLFALIGADPDVWLLEETGVEIAADGRPVYS